MKHLIIQNQHTQNFKPHRLIFVKTEKQEREEQTQAMARIPKNEIEDLRRLKDPLVQRVVNKFGEANWEKRLDSRIFRRLKSVLSDPNKMEVNGYKYLMEALSKGRFPKGGKKVLGFLDALEGTDAQKAYATEILEKLRHDDAQDLSEAREKTFLEELADLRAKEVAKEAVEETGAKAGLTLGRAQTSRRVEDAAHVLPKKWANLEVPTELIERIDKNILEQVDLMKAAGKKRDEHEKALKAKEVDNELLKKLEKEIEELDTRIDKLRAEETELSKEYHKFNLRLIAQLEALDKFAGETGISIEEATRIKIWMIALSKKEGEKRAPLKIKGIHIDPRTGEVTKEVAYIEVVGIHFDESEPNVVPRAKGELDDVFAGKLMITYKDENGDQQPPVNYKIFRDQIINGLEGYEEIDSLDEVNRRIGEQTGYRELAEGQEFKAEIIVEESPDGEMIRETHSFKILQIDRKKGEIVLDRSITKIPRKWLSPSVSPSLYFDRNTKHLAYGEFVKLVQQHRYARDMGFDELDNAFGGRTAARRKYCEGLMEGATPQVRERFEAVGGYPSTGITVPAVGEEREVVFLDHGVRRFGKLKRVREGGEEVIYWDGIPDEEVGADGPDFEKLAGVVPLKHASARRPQTHWERRRFANARSFFQVADETEAADVSKRSHIPKGGAAAESGIDGDTTGKKKYYEEALPLKDVYKYGDMSWKTESHLKELWVQTRFLSVSDFWELGKSMWEYYDRRFHHRQKGKYATAAENLPFWAPEMKRIHQAAENEEVTHFKESFSEKGVFEIQSRLQGTSNRDEMKAAFMILSEKGQLRWDDISMWKNLNRFVNAHLAIPIPANGDPRTEISDKDWRTGFDFLKDAIDSLWGEGMYNDWFAKNKSTFASNAKHYYEEGKELEGVDGGHARRLSVLLKQHKEGHFVDPHEYEGLILHSIEAGKTRMQAKVYYMIEGVAAVNRHGRTILSMDRMAHFNSEMLTRFPLLEYLCAPAPRPGGGFRRFSIDDYKRWVMWFDNWDPTNPDKCKPGVAVDEFLWKYVIPSDDTQNRINKALRNGENLDHDDMFAYLPPATEQVITDACMATTGSKKFLTIEGYANVLPGFSQYMRSLAENNNRDKLREAVKSYIRFEGIMTNRYQKGNDKFQRLDYATLNSATIVTATPPQAFIDGMNGAVKQIIAAYDDPELTAVTETLRQQVDDVRTQQGKKQQDQTDYAFEKFGEVFNRVIKSDNGEKMTAIINGASLEGMVFGLSDQEYFSRKGKYSDKMSLEY